MLVAALQVVDNLGVQIDDYGRSLGRRDESILVLVTGSPVEGDGRVHRHGRGWLFLGDRGRG